MKHSIYNNMKKIKQLRNKLKQRSTDLYTKNYKTLPKEIKTQISGISCS